MAKPHPLDLRKARRGAGYPADRESLASLAGKNGADSGPVDRTSHLGRKEFDGPGQVEKAVFRDR